MHLLSSFRKDLLLLLRDRGEMAALFLMPLAFILPICLAFPSDGYNLNADEKQPLPVAVYDLVDGVPPAHTQELLDSLGESFALEWQHGVADGALLSGDAPACTASGPACDEAVVRGRVQRDERNAGLVIPAGLSAAVDAGEHISLTLVYNPARSPVDRQLTEATVAGSAMQLSIQNQLTDGVGQFEDLIDLVPEEVQAQIRRQATGEGEPADATAATPAPTPQPALAVVTLRPSNSQVLVTPNTVQQTIPGYTVMFVYFLIGTVTASLQLERNTGMMRRLLATPLRRSSFLGGKVLAGLLIGVLQVAAMFAIGAIFFHLSLGNHLPALLLHTAAVVLSAVCIGLAAAAWRIERGINIFLIVAALLAGCAFPADWLPPALRTVNVVLPQTWAMQGYQDLLTRGQGLEAVLPEIGVLLGIAAGFFFLAQRRFQFAAGE
jgi:ABC-2 type transport system permease protein